MPNTNESPNKSVEYLTMKPSYPTVEDTIGHTPLVRLQRIPFQDGIDESNVILAKLEGNNPAGSVKDRPALSMIRCAEERGQIKPGDTLIEATSGNTGIRSEEHTSELQSRGHLVCRLL